MGVVTSLRMRSLDLNHMPHCVRVDIVDAKIYHERHGGAGKKLKLYAVVCVYMRSVGYSSNLKQHLEKWHPDKVSLPGTSSGSSGLVQASLTEFDADMARRLMGTGYINLY